MFSGGSVCATIKDLKDLGVLLFRRCYRHAGPKGPEEIFYGCDRGGQAHALRLSKPPPFTVGESLAMPSERETALVGVRFSRRSDDRGGQAPALRARKGFASPCPVREPASPN